MNAVYIRILSEHPNNRNLQKATDTKINNYEYECHPFEVYSEKWVAKTRLFIKMVRKAFYESDSNIQK